VLCPWIDYLFVGTTQGSLLDVCSKCSRPSGDPWMRVSIVSFVVCWCIHCISSCPFFFWDDTYKIIVYTYSVGCYSAWHDIINSAGYSIKAENREQRTLPLHLVCAPSVWWNLCLFFLSLFSWPSFCPSIFDFWSLHVF